MAEEKEAKVQTESTGKKKPLKVGMVVLGVVLLEAVTIVTVAVLTNAPETEGVGIDFVQDDEADLNRVQELIVLQGRFPNSRQGVTFLYDAEIAVRVKKRFVEQVQQVLDENKGWVKVHVGSILRQAEPRHFEEPYHHTLTRQIEQAIREIVPDDLETNESPIEEVLIVNMMGFPAG